MNKKIKTKRSTGFCVREDLLYMKDTPGLGDIADFIEECFYRPRDMLNTKFEIIINEITEEPKDPKDQDLQ
jgi:hypothetical protein